MNEEHNHDISENGFKHFPKQRRLSPTVEEEIDQLLSMHANKKLVQQHIFQSSGKVVLLKDLHNIKARTQKSSGNDLQALVEEMQRVADSVTKLVLSNEDELRAVFYQDEKMKHAHAKFPELLLLNATYKLNDLRKPLYVLMVVDGNSESQVVAIWIVANEERTTISALVDIFVKNNNA